MNILLATIMLWLSANFDLPSNATRPHVERVPQATINSLRYGTLFPQSSPIVTNSPADDTVVAVYDDARRTIYLPENWTGATPRELSVLVHEMVYHLQNASGLKYACAQEREKVAFDAQQKWLALFGRNLADDFGIDRFTLMVRTSCVG